MCEWGSLGNTPGGLSVFEWGPLGNTFDFCLFALQYVPNSSHFLLCSYNSFCTIDCIIPKARVTLHDNYFFVVMGTLFLYATQASHL